MGGQGLGRGGGHSVRAGVGARRLQMHDFHRSGGVDPPHSSETPINAEVLPVRVLDSTLDDILLGVRAVQPLPGGQDASRWPTRHVTDQGLNHIKRFEVLNPTIYISPPGYPTIGCGHVAPS